MLSSHPASCTNVLPPLIQTVSPYLSAAFPPHVPKCNSERDTRQLWWLLVSDGIQVNKLSEIVFNNQNIPVVFSGNWQSRYVGSDTVQRPVKLS